MEMKPSPRHEQPLVLHFSPALPCTICARMSHYGEINGGCDGLLVRCYEHGLVMFTASGRKPTAHALRELYASITRFVLASFDNFGYATVIGPISPTEIQAIPGYEPYSDEDMKKYATQWEGIEDAWIVRYEPIGASPRSVYVTWGYDENVFSLYQGRDDGAKGGAAR